METNCPDKVWWLVKQSDYPSTMRYLRSPSFSVPAGDWTPLWGGLEVKVFLIVSRHRGCRSWEGGLLSGLSGSLHTQTPTLNTRHSVQSRMDKGFRFFRWVKLRYQMLHFKYCIKKGTKWKVFKVRLMQVWGVKVLIATTTKLFTFKKLEVSYCCQVYKLLSTKYLSVKPLMVLVIDYNLGWLNLSQMIIF